MNTRANVLMITCHDLGRHLGCYGRPTVQSPALDNMAVSGVRFANGFCTAPQCSPSRASLHTGRYPHATGMLGLANLGWNIDPGEAHLAKLLRQQGYHTCLIGLQHLTAEPSVLGYAQIRPVFGGEQAGNAVAQFLSEPARQQTPFYLEVGFLEVHRPYNWQGAGPDEALGVQLPAYLTDSAQARQEFARLQGDIKTLDQGVGIILDALRENGLEQNTWVIFTADHGLAMPRAKCTLYDPGLEISLLMHWPAGGVAGGLVYDALVSNVDVVPTVLQGLGLPLPANLQGRSLWPLLDGDTYQERQEIYAEKTYHTYYHPMRAVRSRSHKLIANFEPSPRLEIPDDIQLSPIYQSMLGSGMTDLLQGELPPVELYDLQNDPLERINLAGQKANAAVENDLKQRLLLWMKETGDPLLQGTVGSAHYHKKVIDRLEN